MTQEKEINSSVIDEPQEIPHQETLTVWGLAWPSILNNLLFSLVGLVSIYAVGHIGTEAVAAVGTGQRIFWIFQAIIMAIMAGTTALVARAAGARDLEEAAQVTRASIGLCVALAFVAMTVVFMSGEAIINIFGLDQETKKLALNYLYVLIIFTPAFSISMVIGTAQRAAGDAKTPLLISVFANVINIFLLLGFVNGRFGLPQLGSVGAALSGGIAFSLASILAVALWLGNYLLIKVGESGSLSKARINRIIHVAYPAAMEAIVFQLGLLSFFWIVALYGTAPVAAYNIGVNLLMVSFTVGGGFAMAGATLTGQQLGAKNPAGAMKSGYEAAGMTVISMGLLGVLVAFYARELSSFFIDDLEVINYTVKFVIIFAVIQPFMALEFALSGALRGAGDTRSPLIITLVGLVLVRVPLAYILYKSGLGVVWVFGTLIADYSLKALLFMIRYRSKRWMKALSD